MRVLWLHQLRNTDPNDDPEPDIFQCTFQAALSLRVVNQQSGEEVQDVFPVHLVGLQDLLQVSQQQLHAEDHRQLAQEHNKDTGGSVLFRKNCKKTLIGLNRNNFIKIILEVKEEQHAVKLGSPEAVTF